MAHGSVCSGSTAAVTAAALGPPDHDGHWVRPSSGLPAEPRWGHRAGIQIGLAPLPGPRGLLRLYAPYVDHAAPRVINFVAVEPVPEGSTTRGYSELEPSGIDGLPGKIFWTADLGSNDLRPVEEPTPGSVVEVDGTEFLRFRVRVERFDNGAAVDVLVSFRSDRPHEVSLSARHRADSAPLARCVLTATMGNYARLRRLHLVDRVVTPSQLWPGFAGDGFAPHARFPLHELVRTGDGAVLVTATPDEADPERAAYDEGTHEHWRYSGRLAEQTWRVPEPDPQLELLANARATYWASTSRIPGGPAFENVEIVEPYRPGREYIFGIDPHGEGHATPPPG